MYLGIKHWYICIHLKRRWFCVRVPSHSVWSSLWSSFSQLLSVLSGKLNDRLTDSSIFNTVKMYLSQFGCGWNCQPDRAFYGKYRKIRSQELNMIRLPIFDRVMFSYFGLKIRWIHLNSWIKQMLHRWWRLLSVYSIFSHIVKLTVCG